MKNYCTIHAANPFRKYYMFIDEKAEASGRILSTISTASSMSAAWIICIMRFFGKRTDHTGL